jgi:3-hydroxybutyryl-CoA dehydrogenase
MEYTINTVGVVGLGTLGAQIALQSAASGYKVLAYDADPGALKRVFQAFRDSKAKTKKTQTIEAWAEAFEAVTQTATLTEAVANADLVIEAVPENLSLKHKVFTEINAAAPAGALLATNSSSMPVSKLETVIDRPERCLNIHFYQPVMGMDMVDVMGGTKTPPEVLEAGRSFVSSLGLVPLKVHKESLGFCFNRVWRAVKRETLHMWAEGVTDFQDIDRAWMIFTGSSWGPFGLMDRVGLDVVRDIEMVYYEESKDPRDYPPKALLEYIDAGRLGVKAGRGFYEYPNPEYESPDFLTPK